MRYFSRESRYMPDLVVRAGAEVDLRRHVLDDRASFIRWYQDPEIAELLRHDLAPLTEVQARGYFDSIVMPASRHGTCWAITLHQQYEAIGTTAVVDINRTTRSSMFRILIGEPELWGQGLGTEATHLVLAEAFENLDLDTVRLEVFSHNPRAMAAYLRTGFMETGRHTEWVARRARQLDVVEMAITRRDWFHQRENRPDVSSNVGS